MLLSQRPSPLLYYIEPQHAHYDQRLTARRPRQPRTRRWSMYANPTRRISKSVRNFPEKLLTKRENGYRMTKTVITKGA